MSNNQRTTSLNDSANKENVIFSFYDEITVSEIKLEME